MARHLAESAGEWSVPGVVALTEEHLIFDAAEGRRRTSLRTVAGAEWEGRHVWVRRRRAHDWLIALDGEADAERVWVALTTAIDGARR